MKLLDSLVQNMAILICCNCKCNTTRCVLDCKTNARKELKELLPGKTQLISVEENKKDGWTSLVPDLKWTQKRGPDSQLRPEEKPIKVITTYFDRDMRDKKARKRTDDEDAGDDDLEQKEPDRSSTVCV